MRKLNVRLTLDRIDQIYDKMIDGTRVMLKSDVIGICTKDFDTKEFQNLQQAI